MAFQYASYAIPQAPPSSLASLISGYKEGRQSHLTDAGDQAAAGAYNGGTSPAQPSALQSILSTLGIRTPGSIAPTSSPAPAPTANLAASPQSSAVPSSYLASVAQAESNNNPSAVNKTTGATGTYQFLPSTWAGVAQAHPELGLTPDGITDPGQQQKAMQAFTLDNAKQLAGAGIAPSPGSLYAAHFLGAGGALKALSAPDDASFASINPAAAAANPNVAGMTIGQFKQWAAQQGGGANGGYSPPTDVAANGQPVAVADRAADLNAYTGMANQPSPAAAPAAASAATPVPLAAQNVPASNLASLSGAGEPNIAYAANAPAPVASAPAVAASPAPNFLTAAQGALSSLLGRNQQPVAAPPANTAAPAQSANGLPDSGTMLAMLRSPDTRPLAVSMIQAAQAGQSPQGVLAMALQRAQIAEAQKQASAPNTVAPNTIVLGADGKPSYTTPVAIPDGYQRTPQGTLQAIPGGPEDPANPLNAMKTGGFGAAMSGNAQVGVNQSGAPDPQQQASFLSSLPAGLAGIVKGIADYDLDATKVTSLRGNQRSTVMQLVQQYDPTFDMSSYAARANMKKSLAAGPLGQQLAAVNTTIQHLSDLSDQADALGNSGGLMTMTNGIKNAVQSATGNQAQTVFRQTAQAVADEASKVFKGAGASDVETIRGWLSGLPMDGSPEQLHAAIANLATKLLPARLDTLQQQYAATMGGKTLPGFLTPQSIAALQKMGIDPTAIDPAVAQNGDATAPAQTSAQQSTSASSAQQSSPLASGTTSSGVQWSVSQ